MCYRVQPSISIHIPVYINKYIIIIYGRQIGGRSEDIASTLAATVHFLSAVVSTSHVTKMAVCVCVCVCVCACAQTHWGDFTYELLYISPMAR